MWNVEQNKWRLLKKLLSSKHLWDMLMRLVLINFATYSYRHVWETSLHGNHSLIEPPSNPLKFKQRERWNIVTHSVEESLITWSDGSGWSLLLWPKRFWRTDIGSSQLDLQDSFQTTKNLLIWGSCTSLVVLEHVDGNVDLLGEIGLCKLWFDLLTTISDSVSNDWTDGLWRNDLVASIDLG